MIGLVMCGGKGTRMKCSEEKLLLQYKMPMIEHVLNAMQKSNNFSNIVCATSSNTPKTKKFVTRIGFDVIDTNGNGYVNDLHESLMKFQEKVFVVSGDMPFLDSEIITKIINLVKNEDVWTSILVTKNLLDSLQLESKFFVIYDHQECAYTGISIVDPKKIKDLNYVKESFIIIDDKRVAINLNTRREFDLFCTA